VVGQTILLLALSLLLVGCADFVDQDQINVAAESNVVIDADHSVGQTFVAHHGGLNAIEFYLAPEVEETGTLVLHLRANSLSDTDILTSSVTVSSTSQPGFYHFSLRPIRHSHSEYYYVFLEQHGPGQTHVSTGDLTAYLDGTLYCDHQPQESQAVFRLSYTPGLILLDLLLMVVGWISYGTAAVVVLFLAGYGIVRRWARQTRADFTAVLILSMVSALSAWMAALVWFSVFHVHLSVWGVRSLVGIATLSGLFLFVRDKDVWQKRTYWLGESFRWTLALWVVVFLSIGLRLFIGRDMVMLPGSDTYHHTLIAQLFAEQGGIPSSYEPYAPLISFSYHFGFHSIVALFRWLFGTELLLTTKTVALVLNGAIAATVGLLAERLAGHRRAGVIAAVLVGLIMVSPFCLLRWGRFTQTAGLLFLPLAILVLFNLSESGSVATSLLIAGLVFSHYRVALMWGGFVLLWGVCVVLRRRWLLLKSVMLVAVIVLVCAGPWLLHVSEIQSDPYGLRMTYPVLGDSQAISRLEKPVLDYDTNLLVLVGIVISGLSIVLLRQLKSIFWLLLGWVIILIIGAVIIPQVIGASIWDLKTTILSLSVPLSLWLGVACEEIIDGFSGWRERLYQVILIMILSVGSLCGMIRLPLLVLSANFYIRPSALVAMEWIDSHLPRLAFLVTNGTLIPWSPGWVVGIDAGYWAPLLAHRDATPPTMNYPLEWADKNSPELESLAIFPVLVEQSESDWHTLFVEHGITYVLSCDSQWPLTPSKLPRQDKLRLVYHQDRILLYEVLP